MALAVREAVSMSKRIGCRIAMLNPADDPQIRRFYTNRGFRYIPASGGEDDVFYSDIHGKIRADTHPLLSGTA